MRLISLKIIMALSGLFLIVFIIGHLLGNLQIFSGPEVFNAYPELLREYPVPLWGMRILVIVAFVSHIGTSIYLARRNKLARPNPYHYKTSIKASLASRTMLYGGLLLLSFLLFHLAHLTWRWVFPEYESLDLYSLTVLSFQNSLVTGFYLLAQIALALHLSHGFSSAGQTLSLTRWHAECIRKIGLVFAILITLAYISIPLSAYLGLLHA